MHDAAYSYAMIAVQDVPTTAAVLELGGRNVNGTVRSLLPFASCYVSVDINDGPDVDVVANAADVDLGVLFDLVISTELLEHTPQGAEIVANAARHLRPGGVFIATMAGPGRKPHGADGAPTPPPGEWYENVEPSVLDGWLRDAGFARWDIDQLDTDVRCTAWVGE